MAKGLKAMHDLSVLHRDIKTDNVLFKSNGDIKLADLGTSITLHADQNWRKTRAGTPSWLAPEQVEGNPYSKPIDIWALGCLIYELASGGIPPFGQSGVN